MCGAVVRIHLYAVTRSLGGANGLGCAASRLRWHQHLTLNGTHSSLAHSIYLHKQLLLRLTARHSLALQCHLSETPVPFRKRRDTGKSLQEQQQAHGHEGHARHQAVGAQVVFGEVGDGECHQPRSQAQPAGSLPGCNPPPGRFFGADRLPRWTYIHVVKHISNDNTVSYFDDKEAGASLS